MKLGGVLVLGAAMSLPVSGQTESAPSAAKPTFEKFALAVNREYLDGPRMQAMCMDHRGGWADAGGNCFFRAAFNDGGALRVALADGMVETVVGDDRMCPDLGLPEGPASYFPVGGAGVSIVGAPLEGEEKGCIYCSIGDGLYKIYKNKAGRWWFRRQGKADGSTPPVEVGKTVSLGEINTAGLGIQPDCAVWNGNVYRIDLVKGTLTCVLTRADYEQRIQGILQKWTGQPNGIGLGSVALSDDGSVFICYYGRSIGAEYGKVFRVSPDRTTVEQVLQSTNPMGNRDGMGMDSGFHCGPCGLYGARGDSVFLASVDSNTFRRWRDGRVATLMLDGEWRECKGMQYDRGLVAKGMSMGPPGSLPYVWIHYPGEERHGINGIFRFGPVDFVKPTVVPNAGGK